jgi:hypothetical protein
MGYRYAKTLTCPRCGEEGLEWGYMGPWGFHEWRLFEDGEPHECGRDDEEGA